MGESENQSIKTSYADQVKPLKLTMEEAHYIPKYQRNYDWKVSHCNALFCDLKRYTENYIDGNSKYMFGQIVAYNSDENKLYILDGQQRLTTATLLVAAIRNILIKIEKLTPSDEKLRDSIFRMKMVLLDNGYNPLLHVYEDNALLLETIITKPTKIDNIARENVSQNNMFTNYHYFYDEFCNMIDIHKNESDTYDDADFIEHKEKYVELVKYYEKFVDFRVCSIYSAHLREAYEMFEAINNRGIPLTSLDLLKNHIYSKCYIDDETLDKDKFKIEEKWKTLTEKLSLLKGGIERAEKYLRYYVNATLEFVRGDEMYEVLIRSIKNNDDALKFIDKFTDALEFFKLAFVSNYTTDEISGSTKRILQGFIDNNFDSYNPMALSVYLKNKGNKKLDKKLHGVLGAYDHFYVLNVIPKLNKTSKIEELTSKLAKQYYDDEKLISDVIKEIYCVNNQEPEIIKSQLEQMNWNTIFPAKYVLSELYNRLNGTNIVDLNSTHLEHILPKSNKKLENHWPNITKEAHSKCINKIGNLLLLNGKTNSKIQDREFSFKKKWYLNDNNNNQIIRYSDIKDDYFITVEEWNENAIDARTKFIVEKIIEVWAAVDYKEDDEKK